MIGAAPIKYTRIQCGYFPPPSKNLFPQRFKERLDKIVAHHRVILLI